MREPIWASAERLIPAPAPVPCPCLGLRSGCKRRQGGRAWRMWSCNAATKSSGACALCMRSKPGEVSRRDTTWSWYSCECLLLEEGHALSGLVTFRSRSSRPNSRASCPTYLHSTCAPPSAKKTQSRASQRDRSSVLGMVPSSSVAMTLQSLDTLILSRLAQKEQKMLEWSPYTLKKRVHTLRRRGVPTPII